MSMKNFDERFDEGDSIMDNLDFSSVSRPNVIPDALLKAKIEEALADPRPLVPMDEAFAQLRARAGLPPKD
jgi:hypothetical protein